MISAEDLTALAAAAQNLAEACRKAAGTSDQGLADSREDEQPSRGMDEPQIEVCPALVTPKTFAELLGINERTLRRWVSAEEVPPPIKIGGVRRWEQEVIDRFLSERRAAVRARLADRQARWKRQGRPLPHKIRGQAG